VRIGRVPTETLRELGDLLSESRDQLVTLGEGRRESGKLGAKLGLESSDPLLC
jgi:hypothetical protein